MNKENLVSNERLAECIKALETERVDDAYALNFGWHELRSALTELSYQRSKPEQSLEVRPLDWKDYRGDGSRQAKTPYGEVLWATPNGWGNRYFPEQFKGSGLEANMAAAEANHKAIILNALIAKESSNDQ